LKKAIAAVILLVTILITACSGEEQVTKFTNASNTNQLLLKVKDIVSVRVSGGLPSSYKQALLLNMEDPKDRVLITRVVTWLDNSKQIDGQVNYGKHGYPNGINIKLKDGEAQIEPAFNCTITKFKNGGSQKTCVPIKGEVVFELDKLNEKYGGLKSVKRIRLKSPSLYDWIQGGWKEDAKTAAK
jgi:hypothetical protein